MVDQQLLEMGEKVAMLQATFGRQKKTKAGISEEFTRLEDSLFVASHGTDVVFPLFKDEDWDRLRDPLVLKINCDIPSDKLAIQEAHGLKRQVSHQIRLMLLAQRMGSSSLSSSSLLLPLPGDAHVCRCPLFGRLMVNGGSSRRRHPAEQTARSTSARTSRGSL